MSFEASIRELETILKELESGELPLEKSIAAFEKGVSLVKECKKQLDTAQGKVTMLLEGIQNEKESN